MNTEYGTLDMTPPAVGRQKRNVWARPVLLLACGIALVVIIGFVLR